MGFARLLELCAGGPFPKGDIRSQLPDSVAKNPDKFIKVEDSLGNLDSDNWEILKLKLKGRERRHPIRVWSPFFETLSEADAFTFLQKHGFTEIFFIPEEPGRRTPDIGASPSCYLEAKYVGMPDQDMVDLNNHGEIAMHEVEHGITPGLKSKLTDTIGNAQKQLLTMEPAIQTITRFVYLRFSPSIDLWCEEEERGIPLVKEFTRNISGNYHNLKIVFNNEILN